MADPAVICEDNGERLMLGPNAHGPTWFQLAWVGSLLLDEVADMCAVGLPREALANLALALLPHLTGDELRRVAEAMPRVAGEWTEQGGEWSRCVDDWTMVQACPVDEEDGEGWSAWTESWGLGGDVTWHPTARAAQAACDARLEAAGVRLCGEVVRDG